MTAKTLLTAAAFVALTVPVLAQGSGGAGASSGGTAAPSATSGTAGTASSATGGTQDKGPNVQQQTNRAQAVQEQKDSATTGTKTAPSQPGDGTVSSPNVGVGHAANGLPIGAPGSGLGSPENSAGPTTK